MTSPPVTSLSTTPPRSPAHAAGGLAAVGCIVVTLHLLGGGLLAPPPVGSFDAFRAWAETRDPVTVGFVCVRLIALAVAYHLIVTTVMATLGHALHKPALVTVAERTTLPPLRGSVRRIAGLTLTAAAALSTPLPGAGAAVAPTAPPVLVHLPARGHAVLERLTPPVPAGGVASMERQPASTAAPSPVAPAIEPTSHIVKAGDHLWSIAEHEVQTNLGHEATDLEISAYWQQLLAANPQLENPDLLFAGDTVSLPPHASAGDSAR